MYIHGLGIQNVKQSMQNTLFAVKSREDRGRLCLLRLGKIQAT